MQEASVKVICPNCSAETELAVQCGQATGFCQKCGEVIDREVAP